MLDLHFGKAVKIVEPHIPPGSMVVAHEVVTQASDQFHSDTLKSNWAAEQLIRRLKIPRNIASLLVELAVFLLNRKVEDPQEPAKPA